MVLVKLTCTDIMKIAKVRTVQSATEVHLKVTTSSHHSLRVIGWPSKSKALIAPFSSLTRNPFSRYYIYKIFVYLMGVAKELIGVGRVRATEYDGCGSHGGGCFTGEIRSRIAWVDPVSPAVGSHILRSLPAVMVAVPISHLTHKQT